MSVAAKTTVAAAESLDATGPHPLASTVEHIPVTVYASSALASKAVAGEIAVMEKGVLVHQVPTPEFRSDPDTAYRLLGVA